MLLSLGSWNSKLNSLHVRASLVTLNTVLETSVSFFHQQLHSREIITLRTMELYVLGIV